MSSLYERLMAAKGAPQAAEAPNSTQLSKAPMNLRSAMSKYAEGGDVEGNNAGVDFAKAAQSGAPFGGLMQAIMAAAQQAQQTTTPSDPIPYSPGEGGRGIPTPYPPPEDPGFYQPPVDYIPLPRYLTPPMPQRDEEYYSKMKDALNIPKIYPEDYAGPRNGGISQQPQGPQTSYRMNDDGSRTEIGYDGQPISGYTPEQLAIHNATRGSTPSQSRYVYNGEGYDLVYDQPPVDSFSEPRYEDIMPVPPPEVFPQYPTDPGFYERLLDYYNPSPPMDFPTDPGFYQPPVDYIPLPNPYPKYPSDPGFYQPPVSFDPTPKGSDDLKKLIEDIISNKGTGNLLENQRKLMSLLEVLKGK
jgi:hypothetical protein